MSPQGTIRRHRKRLGLKPGVLVYDRWWPWQVGVVRRVLKTRVKIAFGSDLRTYDAAHLQFLEPAT